MSQTPLLDELLARVRAACDASERTQAEIAKELGMPPSRLSEYLPPAQKFKPNGETTLRFLRWVESQEKAKRK